jgi:hypothetical protein
MTAIALIIGFAMGCGCTVALLFCLKPVTRAVFSTNGVQKQKARQEEAVESEESAAPSMDEQWANFFAFDGKRQIGKDVKKQDD